MSSRRRPRWLVAIAVAVLVVCVRPADVGAQISPGPLAHAHATLEGATNCAQCHGLRREPMNGQCLACHRDVQWTIDRRRGLHAKAMAEAGAKCASCHPDHAGAAFELIAWPAGGPKAFDHAKAGWTLDGKHARVACEKCHATALRVSPAAALSKRTAGPGYMGLDPGCASCHLRDDPHAGSLGKACGDCHDARGWRPAAAFDHARTDYALSAKHADVACDKCHLAPRLGIKPGPDGKRAPLYKPVPHADCAACHADPHAGRLPGACATCHTTRGFRDVDRKDFNHAATRYPLDGKHRAVRCEGCHGADMSRRAPAFATCAGCHADAHAGEATRAGRTVDCASCHDVRGFAPATFSVADHARTPYALGGRHANVPCATCHAASRAGVAAPATNGAAMAVSTRAAAAPRAAASARRYVPIRLAHERCGSCHADAHGGQVSDRIAAGTCDACHTDAGWSPSTFGTARHAGLKLSLDGRHAAIACAACHTGGTTATATPATRTAATTKATVILAGVDARCESCHADPHAGRYGPGGAHPTDAGCRACHNAQAFRPATTSVEQHAAFALPLDGAHRAAPCVACHEEFKAAPARSTLVRAPLGLASLPFTKDHRSRCDACHASPHGSQFAQFRGQGACEACHALDTFARASRFDHERDARFSLAGAHAKVACGACHKPPAATVRAATPANGVTYRGTPATCEACHGNRPIGRTR